MEKNMLKPNSLISKLPLWLLRGTAVAVLSIAIFFFVTGYKIQIVSNEACAQCVPLMGVGLMQCTCSVAGVNNWWTLTYMCFENECTGPLAGGNCVTVPQCTLRGHLVP